MVQVNIVRRDRIAADLTDIPVTRDNGAPDFLRNARASGAPALPRDGVALVLLPVVEPPSVDID
jgi:hypothetical protein